jgi:hypothetical protein
MNSADHVTSVALRFLTELSRSRERNHAQILFVELPISIFSFHAILNFWKSSSRASTAPAGSPSPRMPPCDGEVRA